MPTQPPGWWVRVSSFRADKEKWQHDCLTAFHWSSCKPRTTSVTAQNTVRELLWSVLMTVDRFVEMNPQTQQVPEPTCVHGVSTKKTLTMTANDSDAEKTVTKDVWYFTPAVRSGDAPSAVGRR